MTLGTRNYYTAIVITTKDRATPATSTTYTFTDRPNLGSTQPDGATWPILRSMSELGVEIDQFLPQATRGTFTIDNSVGSFGWRRKFSDILERETVIEQAVDVYTEELTLDSTAIDYSNKIWSGKIESWSSTADEVGGALTFNVTFDPLADRVLTYQCNINDSNMTDAPESTIGKYLPIAVGDTVFLPGYLTSQVTPPGSHLTFARYAVATNFSNDYTHDLTQGSWYLQDHRGAWVDITDTSGALVNSDPTPDGDIAGSANEEILNEIPTTSDNFAATAATFYLRAKGLASSVATLRLQIREIDLNDDVIGEVVTQGQIQLSDYDAQNVGGGDTPFAVTIPLERIAVLDRTRYRYAFGLAYSSWQSGDAAIGTGSGLTAAKEWRVITASGQGTASLPEYNAIPTANPISITLLGAVLVDFDNAVEDKEGLSAAIVTISSTHLQNSVDAFNELQPVFKVNGIRDDGSGTVTGTPSKDLQQPDQFIELLQKEWDGDSFEDSGKWDFSERSSEYTTLFGSSNSRFRELLGYTDGRQTFREILGTVCSDMACRVGVLNSGKMFLAPWGLEQTPVLTIPPEHVLSASWEEHEVSSVINSVSFSYQKTAAKKRVSQDVAGIQFVDFGASLRWDSDTNSLTTELSADSETLYSLRPLADFQTTWVGDSSSAETLAQSYLAQRARPETFAVITVPYDYKALEIFNVIYFSHPTFPAYYTAHSDDKGFTSDADDTGEADVVEGHHLYRSRTYRGLLEGRYVQRVIGGAPLLRFIIRVLNNYPKDPT